MGNKVLRKRRAEKGSAAGRVSDLRQLRKLGLLPAESTARGIDLHPPVDGLAWTAHARQRFAERIAPDLQPELLYDYLKGRRPMLVPSYVEARLSAAHEQFAPYTLSVRDVCRVVLDWKPHNPEAPDANTRGIWLVVTVLPWW